MCDLLILSVDAIVGASTLRSVAEALGQQLDTAQVCTGFGTAMASAPVISARVVLLSSQPGRLDVPTISTAMKWTQKGGSLVCMEPPSKTKLRSLARMSGLMGTTEDEQLTVGSAVLSKVVGTVPDFDMGAKASIALPAPAAKAVWNLDVDGDDGMLDEDDLLTEEDRQPVGALPSAADCSTAKKACKNCSCGRADAEAAGVKVDLTPDMLDNPQSACGSCGLGDAFRCSTCPYRGMAKFEAGQKIQLSSDFLTADA